MQDARNLRDLLPQQDLIHAYLLKNTGWHSRLDLHRQFPLFTWLPRCLDNLVCCGVVEKSYLGRHQGALFRAVPQEDDE
jgi:hypothetical protein